MKHELKDCGMRELFLWLIRRRKRYRITGDSMLPLLSPGQEILVDPHAYKSVPPKPGDIVLAKHPYVSDTQIVKRLASVEEDGRCYVEGDNPAESTDSRAFGPLKPENIIGRVTSRFL